MLYYEEKKTLHEAVPIENVFLKVLLSLYNHPICLIFLNWNNFVASRPPILLIDSPLNLFGIFTVDKDFKFWGVYFFENGSIIAIYLANIENSLIIKDRSNYYKLYNF